MSKEKKSEESPKSSMTELIEAFTGAIELTRPMQKKNILNRKKAGPWTPKDGSAKLKLRRTHYQHAIKMNEDQLFNEEIALLNKVRPGAYCDGNVKIILRKDRGIDIDYPVKTASQRLRLVNTYGITNLASLLQRCIDEAAKPTPKVEVDPDTE